MVLAPHELVISGVLEQKLVDTGSDLLDLRVLLRYSVCSVEVILVCLRVHVVVVEGFGTVFLQALEKLLHLLLLHVLWLSDLVELIEELGDLVKLGLVGDHEQVLLARLVGFEAVFGDENRFDKVGTLLFLDHLEVFDWLLFVEDLVDYRHLFFLGHLHPQLGYPHYHILVR